MNSRNFFHKIITITLFGLLAYEGYELYKQVPSEIQPSKKKPSYEIRKIPLPALSRPQDSLELTTYWGMKGKEFHRDDNLYFQLGPTRMEGLELLATYDFTRDGIVDTYALFTKSAPSQAFNLVASEVYYDKDQDSVAEEVYSSYEGMLIKREDLFELKKKTYFTKPPANL
ncbi:MAG: hypothetical protein KDK61_09125 [Simkania sp.]|nr:hypothetical protein [Nanoarchaeota archaeon]MCB1084458.1 hypothetical protein [Simkania sp.]